jgi:hypothetical protein
MNFLTDAKLFSIHGALYQTEFFRMSMDKSTLPYSQFSITNKFLSSSKLMKGTDNPKECTRQNIQ